MEEVEYYWKLEFKDGNSILVKPDNATEIKRQLKEEKMVRTADWYRTINDVKSFERTSQPVKAEVLYIGESDLLEQAARAFHEPILENESIMVKWVSKPVTKPEWSRYYSKIPSYRLLSDDVVAYRLPVDLIDPDKHTELTPTEIDTLY
jgi:hypothetical protein